MTYVGTKARDRPVACDVVRFGGEEDVELLLHILDVDGDNGGFHRSDYMVGACAVDDSTAWNENAVANMDQLVSC
jgi:hypothetical protein